MHRANQSIYGSRDSARSPLLPPLLLLRLLDLRFMNIAIHKYTMIQRATLDKWVGDL